MSTAAVRIFVFAGGVLVLANGCAGREDKARKAAETIRSWKATVVVLEGEAGRGAVPEVYARQLRSIAEQEMSHVP